MLPVLEKKVFHANLVQTRHHGRGFESYQGILPHTVLISELPFIKVLASSSLKLYCSNCLQKLRVGHERKCHHGCDLLYYCSVDCQKMDSVLHRYECSLMQSVIPHNLTTQMRLNYRFMTRLFLEPHTISKVDYLISRRHAFSESILTFFSQMMLMFITYGTASIAHLYPPEKWVDFFCMIRLNAIGILNDMGDLIGNGLYPTISLFNHSCEPNCVALHDQGIIVIQSGSQPIPSHTELTLNYLGDTELPWKERQHELQQSYYFTCDCSRCQREAKKP